MEIYKEQMKKASEALDSRDAIRIEYELRKLKEFRQKLTDENLKYEYHVLIYRMLEYLREDFEAFEELECFFKESSDDSSRRWILREMGLTSMRMGQRDKGIEYFNTYYINAVSDKIDSEIADAALWLARFYYEEKDLEQSMEFSNQAVYASRKENNLLMTAEAQLINGLILYEEGKENLALDILREAEEIAIDAHSLPLIQRIAIVRCKIYLDEQNLEAISEIINNLFSLQQP